MSLLYPLNSFTCLHLSIIPLWHLSSAPSCRRRHSARGAHHDSHMSQGVGGNLIYFPVSHVYFFVVGGQSLYPNWMGRGLWPDFPLDPPLILLVLSHVSHRT